MKNFIRRWAPSIILMAVIFSFSSIPTREMPRFGRFDFSIKKLGHAIGYALLAISNARGLHYLDKDQNQRNSSKEWQKPASGPNQLRLIAFAWLVTILYSMTDEIHQSFVPGRNPSLWDVFLFDNGGAIIGLGFYNLIKTKHLFR